MFTALIRSFCGVSAIIAAAVASAWLPAAQAADLTASAWDGDSTSAARLVAAAGRGEAAARVLRAGVEIRLAPGWKTYWRYPGDAGVPPLFDFAGSGNVKSVAVLWPAPLRIDDSEGSTIGYKTNVVFPVHVQAEDPARPVRLALKLDYAVCEKICIPVQARADIALDGRTTAHEARVAAAENAVPRPLPQHADGPLSIRTVLAQGGSPPRILIDVASAGPVALFAEGPAPDWALPLPEPVGAPAAGISRFALVLDGLPPAASATGARLKLTAVSGGQAIETEVRLD